MVTFQLWLFGVGASSGLGCMRLVGAPLKRSGRGRGAGQTSPFCEESVVHIPAFEEVDLEGEDHISAQLCWQPAVGPGGSRHTDHIYEQGG